MISLFANKKEYQYAICTQKLIINKKTVNKFNQVRFDKNRRINAVEWIHPNWTRLGHRGRQIFLIFSAFVVHAYDMKSPKFYRPSSFRSWDRGFQKLSLFRWKWYLEIPSETKIFIDPEPKWLERWNFPHLCSSDWGFHICKQNFVSTSGYGDTGFHISGIVRSKNIHVPSNSHCSNFVQRFLDRY